MTTVKLHILLVDDDHEICLLLSRFLHANGYRVTLAHNTREADMHLANRRYDLMIIDIMMPGESGVEYLQRYSPTIPVIVLSALGKVDDRINGLQSGADDYIAKPFEPRELLLRMNKLIERFRRSNLESQVVFGPFTFAQDILTLDGREVRLTSNDLSLLRLLALNLGKVVSRAEIAAVAVGGVADRTIDTQITRLRSKIEVNPKEPQYIQTVRYVGYSLRGRKLKTSE